TGTFGAFGTAVAAGAAGGFASGFSTSLLNGGSIGCAFRAGLIGGAWGALSAAVTFGIGQYFDGLEKGLCVGDGWGYALDETGRIVAHGVADGLMSEAQGGQFRSGFYAGAFSSAAGSLGLNKTFTTNKDLNYVAHVAAYAAVGGTASVLGGGKFANGATTGAFTYMFNDAAEQLKKINSMKLSIQDPVIKRGLPAGTKDNVDAITAPELHTDILGDTVTATLTGTIYIKADAYDDPDIRNELIAREMEHYDDASALLINNYAGRLQKNLLGQPNDSAAHTYLTNSGKYFSATYNNSGLFWDGNGYHSMRVNADGYPVGGYAGGRPSQAEIERYRRTIYGGEP
ncbi:MAG TPA: hypothetical protein VFB27_06145, partial [Opitutaceae bacterium]|nr:hypothetical protein [Opitutaceae bacterium]